MTGKDNFYTPYTTNLLGLLILFLVAGVASGQRLIISDRSTGNSIENVAVFGTKKEIAEISTSAGEISLDRFEILDTIIFQHPSFIDIFYTKKQLIAMGYHISMTKDVRQLKEVVLSASKTEEKRDDIPTQMEIIDYHDIASYSPQTTADMLQASGNISVQKSQMGGGSPIIRGFEANKILLVVDGVRMNNAIYRSGHLQNVITIDNAVLERTEIIFGPSSMIYGSDALGGVMHFYTKDPLLAHNDTVSNSKINGFIRYASANAEQTTHFDFQVGYKKLGILTGITQSNFHDLNAGSQRDDKYPDFGKLKYYYGKTIAGNDTMLENKYPNVQRNTAYNQVNLLQKVFYRPNPQLGLIVNLQYSSSSAIPRYDKLNDLTNDTLKYAEWHYGPQERLFSSLTAKINPKKELFDKGTIILGFQKIGEDRITRKFRDTIRNVREEEVKVYTLNADFFEEIDSVRSFQYGLETTYNDVQSKAYAENTIDSTLGYASSRYPDGGSIAQSYAAYLSYKWQLSKKLLVNSGIRYSQVTLASLFIDTTTYQFPFEKISINTGAFNGSLGLVARLTSTWQLNLAASTGFRAPNVDDYGKVFGKDDYVMVPNEELIPEYVYNGEMGITKKFNNKRGELRLLGYYTYLINAIVRREAKLNGQDSLVYDGDLLKVMTNTNAAKAIIYGGFAGVKLSLIDVLMLESTISYTYGRDITDNAPLSHIPPVFGKTSINYRFRNGKYLKPANITIYSYYNGWKRTKDYGIGSEDNLAEATVDGTPPWYTLNIKASYDIKLNTPYYEEEQTVQDIPDNRILVVQVGLENIMDLHYRQFASGLSAPGRNLVLSLRAYF
ncbi:MAG TPA: TonB-dependent receptor [Flavobacteriales bacterium]|nr:TonB-dependent receptor [Flavobacteriales bacterium]HIN40691.1 TonB-dependent receptor [Flavobacteriales bacterium]